MNTSDGGSCARVTSSTTEKDAQLDIYVSAHGQTRECALVTDFPKQLMNALGIKATELPELRDLLQVPLASLNAFLVKKGIVGEAAVGGHDGKFVTSAEDITSQGLHDCIPYDDSDGALGMGNMEKCLDVYLARDVELDLLGQYSVSLFRKLIMERADA